LPLRVLTGIVQVRLVGHITKGHVAHVGRSQQLPQWSLLLLFLELIWKFKNTPFNNCWIAMITSQVAEEDGCGMHSIILSIMEFLSKMPTGDNMLDRNLIATTMKIQCCILNQQTWE
jgi:hypothetical protein